MAAPTVNSPILERYRSTATSGIEQEVKPDIVNEIQLELKNQ
jgi:hypothetical protein